MTRLENYWMSNKDWVDFSKEDVCVKEDAPEEAKKSYKIYLEQVKEREHAI